MATAPLRRQLPLARPPIPTPTSLFFCALADLNNYPIARSRLPGRTHTDQPVLAISLGNGDGTFAAPTVMNLADGVNYTQGAVGYTKPALPLPTSTATATSTWPPYVRGSSFDSGILYGNGDGTFTSVTTTAEGS